MADRPEPYVRRNPDDLIRAGDWNEIQIRAREEVQGHDHTGGDKGVLVPRAGIQPNAIDGSRIDPNAAVTLKDLTVNGALKIAARTVITEIDQLIARATALENGKVNRAGDTITGSLTVQVAVRAASVGISSAQPNLPARLCLGTDLANTKIALHDHPTDLYGLGIASGQMRLHVGNATARFSFLAGPAGAEVMTIQGGGNVGIGTTAPQAPLHVNGAALLAGNLSLATAGAIELGVGAAKQGDNGKIAYQRWTDGLDIVGAGADVNTRKIAFHAQGLSEFHGPVKVNGNANITQGLDIDGHANLGYETAINDFGAPLKTGVYSNGGNRAGTTGDVPEPTGSQWTHLITARHENAANNHQLQIAASYASNDRLFFRKIAAGLVSSNPTWNEVATRGANTFTGNQKVKGSVSISESVSVGAWTLEESGNHLFIKRGGAVVARLSVDWDRLLVFRNLNNAVPYFFYNQNGDFGEYRG